MGGGIGGGRTRASEAAVKALSCCRSDEGREGTNARCCCLSVISMASGGKALPVRQ